MGTSIKRSNNLDCFEKIGIFAGSLLVTASAVYFYSPVFKSNAAQDLDSSKVDVTITTVSSLALDTNNLAISVVPTDAGAFTSSSITATVSTNSTAGYELYFSSEDNATNMTHFDSNVSSVIASDFNGTVTSSTMAKNKWGYSLNNTDFSKIPTLSDHVKLKDLDHYPAAAEKDATVYFGTKISSDLPSGRYSKNVKFSMIAHEPVPTKTFFEITTMQEMTPEICASATKPSKTATELDWDGSHAGSVKYVPRTVLTDTRDNNRYLVSKLADGECWMSQNLALDLEANVPVIAATVDGGTTSFTPENSTINEAGVQWGYEYYVAKSYKPVADETYFRNGITKSSTPSGSGDEYLWEKNGNFYNWYAATAGTNVGLGGFENATASICPKGWRLPTSRNAHSYRYLIADYGLDTYNDRYRIAEEMIKTPKNFILPGYHSQGSDTVVTNQGRYGEYWTSTANTDDKGNRNLWLYYQNVSGAENPVTALIGASIRCMAIQ